jgi:hypothetical protein
MSWRECGGPPTSPPSVKGFGYSVIKGLTERAFRGQVVLEFGSQGLVWQLVALADTCLARPAE